MALTSAEKYESQSFEEQLVSTVAKGFWDVAWSVAPTETSTGTWKNIARNFVAEKAFFSLGLDTYAKSVDAINRNNSISGIIVKQLDWLLDEKNINVYEQGKEYLDVQMNDLIRNRNVYKEAQFRLKNQTASEKKKIDIEIKKQTIANEKKENEIMQQEDIMKNADVKFGDREWKKLEFKFWSETITLPSYAPTGEAKADHIKIEDWGEIYMFTLASSNLTKLENKWFDKASLSNKNGITLNQLRDILKEDMQNKLENLNNQLADGKKQLNDLNNNIPTDLKDLNKLNDIIVMLDTQIVQVKSNIGELEKKKLIVVSEMEEEANANAKKDIIDKMDKNKKNYENNLKLNKNAILDYPSEKKSLENEIHDAIRKLIESKEVSDKNIYTVDANLTKEYKKRTYKVDWNVETMTRKAWEVYKYQQESYYKYASSENRQMIDNLTKQYMDDKSEYEKNNIEFEKNFLSMIGFDNVGTSGLSTIEDNLKNYNNKMIKLIPVEKADMSWLGLSKDVQITWIYMKKDQMQIHYADKVGNTALKNIDYWSDTKGGLGFMEYIAKNFVRDVKIW